MRALDADIICLQEIKMEKGQADHGLTGYYEFWNSAMKKGYSGTAIFSRIEPLSVTYGMGIEEHDGEGRLITLEFDEFFLICVYTPNSRRGLVRLPYRMKWEDDFLKFLLNLDSKKPVIVCGDLNVAHQETDIKNAKSNRMNAGFTDDERAKMSLLLESGFADTYRRMNPEKTDAYTWWSYMRGVRERNIGWRIDYFLTSERMLSAVCDAMIYADMYGSDHCPVGLTISGKVVNNNLT
jgi:exodeoxyribonuclease-3